MASKTYDRMWQEAVAELNEQIHIEDDTLDREEGAAPPPPTTLAANEVFQHWACLYIKYLQILKRLEDVYDNMLHPQKRIDVKIALEQVMSRVVILKMCLVKWNVPNPDIIPPDGKVPQFSWEYVNLDDILVDLKLPPETLEVAVPRFFTEDRAAKIKVRNKVSN